MTNPQTRITTELSGNVATIKTLMAIINDSLDQAMLGNKTKAQRARSLSIELQAEMKKYRKLSAKQLSRNPKTQRKDGLS